jgi:beta-lactam-binding protein with PASTA domain
VVPAGGFDGRELPDLRGLSAREAVRMLAKMGLTAHLHGNGLVASQMPAAGTPIDPGAMCELWLERAAAITASLGATP